jgi:hypothetical protein
MLTFLILGILKILKNFSTEIIWPAATYSISKQKLSHKNFFEIYLILNMDSFISTILSQVHPDTQIDAEARDKVKSIIENLANKKQNLTVDQWINNTLIGELATHATSESRTGNPDNTTVAAFPNFTRNEVAVLEYILAEVLELAGNHARDRDRDSENYQESTIDIYDLYSAINNDEELRIVFKNDIPPFPLGFAERYTKFKIQTFSDESTEYHKGLLDVLTALVNYYADNFTMNALWDYQKAVGEYINHQAGNNNPGFKDLFNAVYNNPNVRNIPWVEVFKKAI